MSDTTDSEEVLIILNGKVHRLSYGISPEVARVVKQKLSKAEQLKENYELPPLSDIYNVNDFAEIAENFIDSDTWVYYRTGAADEITLHENIAAFKRIYFKPRILNNVSKIDTTTTIFGSKASSPFYITAFHGSLFPKSNSKQAEKPLIKAAGQRGIIQMIPQMSIFSLEELLAESVEGQRHWLQIYVHSSKQSTIDLIKRAEKSGKIDALFFTVDSAQLGRRETELKHKGDSSFVEAETKNVAHSATLDWDTIREFRKMTDLKMVLKGIQTVEDSLKLVKYGFNGILLSNHGGRQLDTARSAIEILAEVVPILKSKNLYHKVDIFVDGGVRRGSDIAKALCLGAKGVGLGRPFLYPLVTYGVAGVLKSIDILQQDLELNMRLLGAKNISELHEGLVDTTDLSRNRYTKL